MPNTKTILIDKIPPDVHDHLRYIATLSGISMKATALEALRRGLIALSADPELRVKATQA